VLKLQNSADDIVTVSIDGKDRYRGKIGLRRFRKAVEIESVIDTEKDSIKRALEELERNRKERLRDMIDQENEEASYE
jgi:flagellar motor switch protein FliM